MRPDAEAASAPWSEPTLTVETWEALIVGAAQVLSAQARHSFRAHQLFHAEAPNLNPQTPHPPPAHVPRPVFGLAPATLCIPASACYRQRARLLRAARWAR